MENSKIYSVEPKSVKAEVRVKAENYIHNYDLPSNLIPRHIKVNTNCIDQPRTYTCQHNQ